MEQSPETIKIEFKRDPETGQLIAYEDGVEIGPILTMGDLLDPNR